MDRKENKVGTCKKLDREGDWLSPDFFKATLKMLHTPNKGFNQSWQEAGSSIPASHPCDHAIPTQMATQTTLKLEKTVRFYRWGHWLEQIWKLEMGIQ